MQSGSGAEVGLRPIRTSATTQHSSPLTSGFNCSSPAAHLLPGGPLSPLALSGMDGHDWLDMGSSLAADKAQSELFMERALSSSSSAWTLAAVGGDSVVGALPLEGNALSGPSAAAGGVGDFSFCGGATTSLLGVEAGGGSNSSCCMDGGGDWWSAGGLVEGMQAGGGSGLGGFVGMELGMDGGLGGQEFGGWL